MTLQKNVIAQLGDEPGTILTTMFREQHQHSDITHMHIHTLLAYSYLMVDALNVWGKYKWSNR